MIDRFLFISIFYYVDLFRYDYNLLRESNVMICWGIGIVRIDKFKSSCVKLDKYDGNFLWIDFKFYFDVCVELNEMDIEEIEEERVVLFDIYMCK